MAGVSAGDAEQPPATGGGAPGAKLEEPDHSSSNWYFSREEIEKRSPSRIDGIDLKKETYFRKSYCTFLQDLGMSLKVPQVTIATAIVFCHRFFLRQSHLKNDRHMIATICMFLAGKVEETPRPLRDVILMSYEIRHKKNPVEVARIKQKDVYEEQKELVLVGERLVLTSLGFDLNIHHPYKPLVAAIKKFKVAQNALAQVAWNFVNDGLRTSLCLQFKPHHIASGAIFLAAKFLKVKLPSDGDKVWWQEFGVTPRQLEEVSNQMLELYEQNKSGGANASRSSDPCSSTGGKVKLEDEEPKKSCVTTVEDINTDRGRLLPQKRRRSRAEGEIKPTSGTSADEEDVLDKSSLAFTSAEVNNFSELYGQKISEAATDCQSNEHAESGTESKLLVKDEVPSEVVNTDEAKALGQKRRSKTRWEESSKPAHVTPVIEEPLVKSSQVIAEASIEAGELVKEKKSSKVNGCRSTEVGESTETKIKSEIKDEEPKKSYVRRRPRRVGDSKPASAPQCNSDSPMCITEEEPHPATSMNGGASAQLLGAPPPLSPRSAKGQESSPVVTYPEVNGEVLEPCEEKKVGGPNGSQSSDTGGCSVTRIRSGTEEEETKKSWVTSIEDVDTDRVRALAQRRRRSRGEGDSNPAPVKSEISDEEELLERELENGVEAAAEAERVSQETRDMKPKSLRAKEYDTVEGWKERTDHGKLKSKPSEKLEQEGREECTEDNGEPISERSLNDEVGVQDKKRMKSAENGDRTEWPDVDHDRSRVHDRREDGEIPTCSNAHEQESSPRHADRRPATYSRRCHQSSSSQRHRDSHMRRDGYRDSRVANGSRDRDYHDRDRHYQQRTEVERDRHYHLATGISYSENGRYAEASKKRKIEV